MVRVCIGRRLQRGSRAGDLKQEFPAAPPFPVTVTASKAKQSPARHRNYVHASLLRYLRKKQDEVGKALPPPLEGLSREADQGWGEGGVPFALPDIHVTI
jgi:hypothetical protein